MHTPTKEVWLTFDDGPDPKTTPWILDLLKKHEIQASFFLIGREIKKYPNIIDRIKKENHVIGNHTHTHINGWFNSTSKYIEDVNQCQKFIPKNNLFRPPYGKITPWQIQHLKKDYKLILWDILAYDFKKNIKSKKVKNNILNNISKGSIITLHNNKGSLPILQEILEDIIIEIKKLGFSFSNTW